MGELTFFLGLLVTQKDDGIFISQDKYVDDILKKFGFSTVKTASTPMETSKPLIKDESVKYVDVHLYRSMIGSLMYLTSSRPDIMFAVCACARFQVTPKVSHLQAVKRIFRYLKGNPQQEKKQSRRKQRQDTEVPQPSDSTDDVADENIPTHSNDLPQSGKDRLQLNELMEIYTNLQKKVLDLEASETAQDQEILSLKQRVKKLEKKKKSKPHGLIRLYKGKNDDNLLFYIGVLDGQEVMADKDVSTADLVTTANVEVTTASATTTIEEQALAFTPIVSSLQPSQVKDKGKAKMVEEEPIKKFSKKEQIRLDQELAFKLQAKEEEERLNKKRIKKQKIDDDQEEAEMKQHMEIVIDEEEIAVDAILLAIKPPIIVDMKIIKEGKIGYFQIIRANRSSKRVHFVRFQNLHIYMLVEKTYPLTPATITDMLNKKLQAYHWNEICYQLLKLMTKQLKKK
ncbi:hypothetical protein Tco_1290876 [Tanacetum coccineum]